MFKFDNKNIYKESKSIAEQLGCDLWWIYRRQIMVMI